MARDPELGAIAAATEAAQCDAERQPVSVTFERIVVVDEAAAASFVIDGSRPIIVGLERICRGEPELERLPGSS